MSLPEVIFWFAVAIGIMVGIHAILSRIWEFILDKWEDFHFWVETRNTPPITEPLDVIPTLTRENHYTHPRFREHDTTEGIPNDLAPGTRVVFPSGHYIITRPSHIQTNGYGRMKNKPHTRIPGYEYTI